MASSRTSENLSEFLEEYIGETNNNLSEDDLFTIFESLDTVIPITTTPCHNEKFIEVINTSLEFSDNEASPTGIMKRKFGGVEELVGDGQQRLSHITVERNRRKQMNEHLTVLRSLMPCFYVKRGDQASIIEGVVDYINELQQILQSLDAKKQRKVIYNEILSPRPSFVSSPRPLNSPRKPPLSPRPLINLPISPRTPQPRSPYNPNTLKFYQQGSSSPTTPTSSSTNSSNIDSGNEPVVATSKSAISEVEVRFSGPNLVLKTTSPPIPGQSVKIISALEELALEILNVNVSTVDETMLNSFTIKIGIECKLSAEELAHQIQQTFC
ncbi:hypothetical protein ACFE04_010209 [Oxalis oulophora]